MSPLKPAKWRKLFDREELVEAYKSSIMKYKHVEASDVNEKGKKD